MLARVAVALGLVFAGVPARADVSVPASASDGVLSVTALRGPFVSIAAYCEQTRREEDNVVDCTVARRRAHTAAIVIRWGGHQRYVDLAIENGAGWWIDEGILYDSNRGRGSFFIEALSDEPGSARLRAVEADWWKPNTDAELDRFDHDIYYCFALEVRCWERPSGPVCSVPLPVAGRRDCGLGDERDEKTFVAGHWDWEQQIRDSADGRSVELRRRAWRHFAADSHGYDSWFEQMTSLARTLADTRRRIDVTSH